MDKDSFGEGAGQPRPPRDPGTPDFGQHVPALARTVRIVAGDFLLTVNPVDGSEIEPCPPGEAPAAPVRHTAEERAELQRTAQPPVPPGPLAPRLPLLERDEERERLVGLLGRGRSVRLSGPAGSGRSALLDTVAEDCATLAPDGVVRLNGLHRTPTDLLHELFAAVYKAPQRRPDRTSLLTHIREIGAIVVLDDLEFGGASLAELLDAAPECAFLLAATPDVPAPGADAHLEEVGLTGLGRAASLDLLERTVERPLTEDETNWAGDLWFESEGLPLRFVQAGALLRQCDELRADPEAFEAYAPYDAAEGNDVPLPSLGEGAAPAALLASRLSDSARETLRFAVALGGEVPHQAHLPALVGDTHADAALGELMSCGLLSSVGGRYRLAAGVPAQLTEKGYAEDAAAHAHTAAQHYAWWAGHPSVTPERAVAESDALLAALTALVPGTEAGHPSAAVLLARSAAPAFAAGMHWGAWERVLRVGSEAARIAGEVAEEAYFHHELGILALCTDSLDRARAELEASIALRGALADKNGTVSGRRALALVTDRENGLVPSVPATAVPAGQEVAPARQKQPSSPAKGAPANLPVPLAGLGASRAVSSTSSASSTTGTTPETLVASRTPADGSTTKRRRPAVLGSGRNLVAAGAGALLAVVLGTVVTLGATSDNQDPPSDKVGNGQSANQDDGQDGLTADEPENGSDDGPSDPSDVPDPSGAVTPGSSASTDGAEGPDGGVSPSRSEPGGESSSGKPKPTKSTPKPPTTSGKPTPSETPSDTPSDTPSETPSTPSGGPTSPDTPDEGTSAGGPTGTSGAPMTSSAPVSEPAGEPVI
ncbi:ATP-binding protein [Streptomyces sp. NPDC058685]|uniref:ATP-binding protein n=1 Tax=Streptomyces sp. NPDC058685 TaxID=3346598 RepID=UPI00365D5448